jgi:hemolysin activation/secretion protein
MMVCATADARAQVVPPRAPDTALPGQQSPIPGIVTPSTPQTFTPAAPQQATPGAVAPSETVAIEDAAVEGATVYPQAAFAPYLDGLTGPAVPVARIEAARTEIVNRYRNKGYPYVAVNARIRGGHLRFVVIEGRIVSVKLRGDIGPAGTQVLRFLNHLTEMPVVTQAALERWLLLANDIPGVKVHAVINPSSTDPGALTLEAEVSRDQFDASLRADNRAFRETGPEELLAVAHANSFTSLGEQTELSMYHTFNNTDTFGQAAEQFFVGGSGLSVRLYGGAGESIPSGVLRTIGYDGVTRVFGASVSYPLIRSRIETLTLRAHFDGFESDISETAGFTLRTFDSLRILRGEAEYERSDRLLPFLGSASNVLDAKVSQGLPAFGASSEGNAQLPRLNERIDFTKGSFEWDRTQPLFVPAQRMQVSLLTAVAGQYTNTVLPPEEEYYLGGPTYSNTFFNPGYYYGQVTGDRALQFKVEPRLDLPPVRLPFTAVSLLPQAYAFYDWGETWEVQKIDLGHTLRSIGGGMRFKAAPWAEIDVEGVSRLTRSFGEDTSRLKSSAVYWQLLLSWQSGSLF